MTINKHNYEAFFLDYHEGSLTPQQVADLLLFVEQNPELREEFESFENLTLEDYSTISFEGKASLKKEINAENREEYFIRSVENTLNLTEKKLLNTFIQQHPHYLTELELFGKTKLQAETNIVFENKEALKKHLTPTLSKGEGAEHSDDLLIASVEGLLTKQESAFLNQQLSVDAEMQNDHALYLQTKLVADQTLVYENKDELKREERKIIPFFYYVAAAASIALLIGLFFIYNNGSNKGSNLAETKETKPAPVENNSNNVPVKNNLAIEKKLSIPNQTAVAVNNKKENSSVKKNPAPLILNEKPENTLAVNKNENKIEEPKNEVIVKNEEPKTNIVLPSNSVTLSVVEGQATKSPTEFLSLKQVVAEKIKEKTLDDATLAVQKKNGRATRFTGWDMLQLVTKGISNLTGRDVEVKPTYNDEGDVTAYALGNGVQVSRGK